MKLALELDIVNSQFSQEKEYLIKQLEKKEHRDILVEEVVFSIHYATRIKPGSVQEILYWRSHPDERFDANLYVIGCISVSCGKKRVVYPDKVNEQQKQAVLALIQKKWKLTQDNAKSDVA